LYFFLRSSTSLLASAAQTLAQVQAQVNRLEEEATTAAEGAQEAKVKLAALTRSLAGIQAQAAVQGKTVMQFQRPWESSLSININLDL
jgi:hypothetical protein